MKNDPILQELLAEFDEKFVDFQHEIVNESGSHDVRLAEWIMDFAPAEFRSFLTSAVLRTRERVVEEAMRCLPEAYVGNDVLGEEDEWASGFNQCRAATLEALTALREKK